MTDAAQNWKTLLGLLNDRLKSLRHEEFYDPGLDRYHPLRGQIIAAFRCARLADDAYAAIFPRVPSIPEIESLGTLIAEVPLDELSVHFVMWFSAERWGVNTVHQVFQIGALTAALDRFADPNTRLPFTTFDTRKIQQITSQVAADSNVSLPRRDGS